MLKDKKGGQGVYQSVLDINHFKIPLDLKSFYAQNMGHHQPHDEPGGKIAGQGYPQYHQNYEILFASLKINYCQAQLTAGK